MSRLSFLKFPTVLICGCLVSNGGEVAPKKRPYRSIGPASNPISTKLFEETKSESPALKTPDHSGRVRDSQKSIQLAQAYYQRQLWESASKWYLDSLQSDPENQIAAEGYVMSLFHQGLHLTAYQYGEEVASINPHVKASVSRIAQEQFALMIKDGELTKAEDLLAQFPNDWEPLQSGRNQLRHLTVRQSGWKLARKSPFQSSLEAAEAAYKSGQYTTSLWNLDQASQESPLPRDAKLIKGRSLIHLGRFDEAVILFEKLYQTQADVESARGIVVALHKKGDHDRLSRLANEWGGILALETETYHHIEPDTDLSDVI